MTLNHAAPAALCFARESQSFLGFFPLKADIRRALRWARFQVVN